MRRALGLLVILGGCTTFGEPNANPDASTPVVDAGESSTPAADAAPDGASVDPNDGGDAATTSCPGGPDCERVVFITSLQFYPADLGGVAGADMKCQQVAAASTSQRVVGRIFRAWLSDATGSPAKTFVRGTKDYVRPSGAVIAANWEAFTSGTHVATMNEDENGVLQSQNMFIWTGTKADGTGSGSDCLGWKTNVDPATATRGVATQVDHGWSADSVEGCNTDHRIYCVEQ